MILATAIVVFWIVCGVLDYGFTFKYFRTQYPMLDAETDARTAFYGSLFGPLALLASVICGHTKHGLGWRE